MFSYFTSTIVMSCAVSPLHWLKSASRMRVTSSAFRASLSVMTVTLALLPSRFTTQSVKPFDLMSVSSLVSSVILLMRSLSWVVSCSFSSLVSLVSFRDFFRVSSASSRALLRVKRADSKNSVPESLFTLTSWASP